MEMHRRRYDELDGYRGLAARMLRPLLWALATASLALPLIIALAGSTGWDGHYVWQAKTCLMAEAGVPFPPLRHYSDPSVGLIPVRPGDPGTLVGSHIEYPLLLPWLQLLLGGCGGGAPQRGDAVAVLILAVAVGLMGRAVGRHVAPVAVIVVALAPPVATDGLLGQGYADVLVAGLFALAVALGLRWRGARSRGRWVALAVALAGLVWAKQEGAILALVLVSLLACADWPRPRAALLTGMPALLVVLAWQVFLRVQHAKVGVDFAPAVHPDRLVPVASSAASLLLSPAHFGLLVLAALPGCYALWRADRRAALVLVGAAIVPIALYAGLYTMSSWPDWREHVRVSLPRLLLHTVGPQVILGATGLVAVARSLARRVTAGTPSPACTATRDRARSSGGRRDRPRGGNTPAL